jgi:hypothetical protein
MSRKKRRSRPRRCDGNRIAAGALETELPDIDRHDGGYVIVVGRLIPKSAFGLLAFMPNNLLAVIGLSGAQSSQSPRH